jgi:hypothetical protein
MPDPFDDVSWSDLAAELGVETPKAATPPEPPLAEEPAPEDLGLALFDPGQMPDAQDANPDTEVIEPGSAESEAERKRRRRRRRKKKTEIGEAPEGGEVVGEAPPATDDGVTQPSELLRDILKNWDVPSWGEIVGGLYRPNR